MKFAATKLTPYQQKRINVLADAILDMNEAEEEYLWRSFRDKNEQAFGVDPALFSDFVPKIEKKEEWPELAAESLNFFKAMATQGEFPGGFVSMIMEGRTVELIPSGMAPTGGRPSGPAAGKKQEAKQEEKTNFNVVLKNFTADGKIKIIREVKNVLNIGLKEAKDQVEAVQTAPIILGKNLTKDKAEELAKKFTDVGGEVSLE